MADDKVKPEDMAPQADKQAHTEIAEREGTQVEQARLRRSLIPAVALPH